ncbi:MAG: SRPBCC family protein [Gaiellaceae bacterium]
MADENGTNSVKEKVEDVVGDGSRSKEILASAAVSAVGALAAAKGPDVVRRVVGGAEKKGEQEAEEMGEKAAEGAKKALGRAGGPLGKAASKLLGGGGGGGGGKKTRRLPIQRWTDVAASVDKVYEAWTKFDEFPRFMHRVLNVEQKGRDKLSWQEKIWFSSRKWEGRVTDRRKNDRIVWKTTSGMEHKGVVSFHKLAENLTRVMVTMEFEPNGMVEKMASGLRFVKRAVQADLARFKAYVEMDEAKGIEYRPNPEEDEDRDADEATTRGRKSDEVRTRERKQREKGREQRRKSRSR